MKQQHDSQITELGLICSRLASHATVLGTHPPAGDPASAPEVSQLVARALEIIQSIDTPASITPAPAKGGISGFLSKMLGSGESAPAPAPAPPAAMPARSEDNPPSERHMLALRVYGKFLPAPDLIGFLSTFHRTGILEAEAPGELFLVEFEEGDIVHAQSDHMPGGQRLGDILVSKGFIARPALEAAHRDHPGGRLGEVLLQRGLVDKEQLLAALQTQIQLLFNRMFEAPTTRFTFWAGPPLRADEKVRLNATSLLLEGARASDEAKWSWRKID